MARLWAMNRRKSLMILPYYLIALLLLALVLWFLHRRFGLPIWTAMIIIAPLTIGVVGDSINILLARRNRFVQSDNEPRRQ